MADIDKLIAKLDKLTKALEASGVGGGATSGGGTGSILEGGSGSEDKSWAEQQIEQRNKLLKSRQKMVEDLQQEEAARGTLSRQKQLDLEIAQQELDILEQYSGATADQTDQIGAMSEALEKQAQKTKKAREASDSWFKGLNKGRDSLENVVKNSMSFGDEAEKIYERLPKSTSEIISMGHALKDTEFWLDATTHVARKLMAESINMQFAMDRAAASYAKMTSDTADNTLTFNDAAHAIHEVDRATRIFGGTTEDAKNARVELHNGMRSFTTLSEKQKTELMAQSVVMQKLGIDHAKTAQVFDQATKSLGFNEGQLVGLTEELHATAQSLGMSTAQVLKDFASVSKQLAFYGTDVVDVFKDLEKQSKATGLEVDQLIGISGKGFDTFDGAAQKVGRLNAILGGPYLNSIDMLNANEAERIEMLKQSMDASGQMFNELGKYEQLAIADALNVDVDTARRMFGELDEAEEMNIRKKERMAETARKAQATMAKLANAFNSLIIIIDPFIAAFAGLVELFSKAADTKVGKVIMQIGLYAIGTVGAIRMLTKAFGSLTSGLTKAGQGMQNLATKPGSFFSNMGKYSEKLFTMGERAENLGTKTADAGTRAKTGFSRFTSSLGKSGEAMTKSTKSSSRMGNALRSAGKAFSEWKIMPNYLSKLNIGLGKGGPLMTRVSKILGGFAKVLYPLELAWHTIMSLKDNWNLFGDALSGGEGVIEKTLGWIGAQFIIIGDAAARATDSLANFASWIANIFLPEKWEIPELNLSGMIQDSLANLDMGFITETFGYMGQAISDGIASMLPDKVAKFLGFGEAARSEKAEVDAIQAAENRRAEREGREAKTITAEDVEDVIVTSSGRVLKPSAADSIAAFKPDGPLLEGLAEDAMAAFQAGTAPLSMAMSGISKLGSTMGSAFGRDKDPQKGEGTTVVKFDNGAIVVKIGEEQLRDVILKSLKDPEVSRAISGLS